ncbi:MAG: methyltransferase domain-containing protein [Bacteroidota bacterium]
MAGLFKNKLSSDQSLQVEDMKSYYAFQAKIYDWTRWSFLFGRDGILKELPLLKQGEYNFLEVGCGTGTNLKALAAHFPKASITGLDVSGDMVKRARRKNTKYHQRVEVHEKPYTDGLYWKDKFDLILFSYSLTMINPQWKSLIQQATRDLKPGGHIAVVDFHDSKVDWFKEWMKQNHVRMDSHILPVLKGLFHSDVEKVRPAYSGMWQYFMFIGSREK